MGGSPTIAVIRDITADQLEAATPCAGWDVRDLVQHMLFYGPAMESAARKEPAAFGRDALPGDWQPRLEQQIDRLVAAWGEPTAWQGTTSMVSPAEMPAHMNGGMVLGELVVHGWDLGRATGRRPAWDEELLGFVHQEVAKTPSLGREMGVYGPEVPVADTAPTLDRTLALTGREPDRLPGWTSSGLRRARRPRANCISTSGPMTRTPRWLVW